MKLRYVLFDLDGTLTDSMLGITNCAMYALEKFGIYPRNREELLPYIGPPLLHSFMTFHGLDCKQAEEAVAHYRERFAKVGWKENEVFEGISALLAELKGRGATLIVATSKPEEFTHRILEHFDLKQYFAFVAGSTLDGTRSEKADVIAYVQEKFPDISRENALMVGDRKFDVIGAHQRGLAALGVLYGYGDRAEMEAAKADFIIEDIPALRNWLLQEIE